VHVATRHPLESPLVSIAEPDAGPPDLTFEVVRSRPPPASAPGESGSVFLVDLVLPGGICFQLFSDRIVAYTSGDPLDGMVEIHFLGSALAAWLEHRGVLALHASAVVIGGRAVAFLASNKGGKTALAAACMQAGHPLLTDDLLAVEPCADGSAVGYPGYPQMRMWADNAAWFVGREPGFDAHGGAQVIADVDDVVDGLGEVRSVGRAGAATRVRLRTVHPTYPKFRVAVGNGGFGSFCDRPVALGSLWIPRRVDSLPSEQRAPRAAAECGGRLEQGWRQRIAVEPEPDAGQRARPESADAMSGGAEGAVKMVRVGPSEAVVALLANTFSEHALLSPELRGDRLRRMVRLAESVPMYHLEYPAGYEHLERVVGLVSGSVGSDTETGRGSGPGSRLGRR